MAYLIVPDNIMGGWDVRIDNRSKPDQHFDTQAEAIVYGQRVSNLEGESLVVHNEDGNLGWQIQRNSTGAELIINNESGELPLWINDLLQDNIRGIPRGQAQPQARFSRE